MITVDIKSSFLVCGYSLKG